MNISSSTSSTSSTSAGRLTGLATGLDIDALVKQGLAGDQAKIDKENQNKQYLQWQQEAYVDIITSIRDFSDLFDILKSDNLITSSSYAGAVAQVNGASTALTVNALPGAIKGNYEVTINKLAEGAKLQSQGLKDNGKTATLQSTLNNIGITPGGSFTITVGSKDFTIDTTGLITLGDLVNKIKDAKTADGTVSFTSIANVSVSELTGKMTFESKQLGQEAAISFKSGGTLDIIGSLGITNKYGVAAIYDTDYKGQNADIAILPPGETVPIFVTDKPSNNFTIDNITYNLNSVTTGFVSISVNSDASTSVTKLKKFIEKYNSLVEKLSTKVNEKKSYSYKPLTDSQKSQMKDTEITNWETQAKKGILRRDSVISGFLTDMRNAIFTSVSSVGITISEIGLSTTSNYLDGGKLQLDEGKLKTALEQKGDLVQKLFTNYSTDDSEAGIFQRIKKLTDSVAGNNGTLVKKAGYTNSKYATTNDLTKMINDKNDRITKFKDAMNDRQQRLYSMYATLEKNMNSLNSQSSWLASSLGNY